MTATERIAAGTERNTPRAVTPSLGLGSGLLVTAAAVFATFCALGMLLMFRRHAGGLWRDEVNSVNFSTLPTLGDMWKNSDCESFPLLWPLIERGWTRLLGTSDDVIRDVGLLTGVVLIAAIWLGARWSGYTPLLTLALVATNPVLLRTACLNRAYGLGFLLIVFAYHALWKLAEAPTRRRAVLTGLVALTATQTLYYDIVFIWAMLLGALGVQWYRGNRGFVKVVAAIGGLCALSLLPYVFGPIRWQRAWSYTIHTHMSRGNWSDTIVGAFNLTPLRQVPFHAIIETAGLMAAWLAVLGLCIYGLSAFRPLQTVGEPPDGRRDVGRYASVTALVSLLGYAYVLGKVGYFVETFHMAAISLLVLIAASHFLSRLRFSVSVQRVIPLLLGALFVITLPRTARAVMVRQTNIDLVAQAMNTQSKPGDFVIVTPWWFAQTFARYYHGPAAWTSAPTLPQYLYGGVNYLPTWMLHPRPDMDHLQEIATALRSGHAVWLITDNTPLSNISSLAPLLPPEPPTMHVNQGALSQNLRDRVIYTLSYHAAHEQSISLTTRIPVYFREDVRLYRFAQWTNHKKNMIGTSGNP